MYNLENNVAWTNDLKNAFTDDVTMAKIVYQDNGTTVEIDEDTGLMKATLKELRYVPNVGAIGQAVAKQLELELNNIDEENPIVLENKEITFKIGITYNNVDYYINYGNFIVTEAPEVDETNGNIKVVALDYMQKFNQPFKDEYEVGSSTVTITYPCTLYQYLQHVCNQAGVTLATQSITNGDFIVTNNQFQDKTLREVLQHICKSAFTWARIGQDNQLYLDFEATGTAVETLTEDDYYADSFKKANEYYGAINKVTYADTDIQGQEESVVASGVAEGEEKELIIYDNYFAYTSTNRQQLIQNGTVLFGLYYMPISQLEMRGFVYLDSSDFINITAPDETVYFTKVFNHIIEYEGYVKDSIENDSETEVQQEYKNTSSPAYQNAKAEISVDRANQKIALLTSKQIVVYNEKEQEGLIETEEAKELPTWVVRLTGEKTYDSGAVVVPTSYTIIVMPERYPFIMTEDEHIILTENNEEIIYSAHKYTIECNELLRKDAVSDTIEIAEDRNIILTRRIGISEGQTYILDEEVVSVLGKLTVDLYQGKNYIYLEKGGQLDEETLLYVKYILENDFTDNYVSSLEIISAINQSPEEIKIQSPKISLEGYTTINEGFSVDDEGNMTCNDATINGTMRDKEGNILVWDEGVYSNLQFTSTCIADGELDGRLLSHIGYYQSVGTYWLARLIIETNIPSNFKVTSAYITVTHQPIEYSGSVEDEATSQTVNLEGTIGYARGVQIFADGSAYGSSLYELEMGSEVRDSREMSGTNTYGLGANGKTFSDTETEVVISSDLSQYLESGGAMVFKIGTLSPASTVTGIKNMYERIGRATAKLNVYGYLKEVKEDE